MNIIMLGRMDFERMKKIKRIFIESSFPFNGTL